jgi:PAS domain-containing protein
MVNNQYYQATVAGSSSVSNDLMSDENIARNTLEDENAVFVQGLDYKNVFKRCGVALAVASIDGRFMDCNEEFEQLSGYSRNELLPPKELSMTELRPDAAPSASTYSSLEHPPRNLSLFNLLTHQDMEQVFMAMSGMLKRPIGSRPGAPPATNAAPHQDYWCGVVRQNREHNSTVRFLLSMKPFAFGFVSSNVSVSLLSFAAAAYEHYASPDSGWAPQVLQLLLEGRTNVSFFRGQEDVHIQTYIKQSLHF